MSGWININDLKRERRIEREWLLGGEINKERGRKNKRERESKQRVAGKVTFKRENNRERRSKIDRERE